MLDSVGPLDAKEEFSARLRAAMKAAGMQISGTELERAFNRKWKQAPIRVQTAWNWINGKTMPRNDKLKVLAAVVRAKPNDLLFGGPEPLTAADRRRTWEDKVNYAERETIEAFLRLPTPQRLIVRDVIATYAQVHGAVDPGKA
jgi:transcriptional regulator with XRE-family HTH domain